MLQVSEAAPGHFLMTTLLVTHTAVPRSSWQHQCCHLWYDLTLEFDLFPATAVSTPASLTLRETLNKPCLLRKQQEASSCCLQ